MWNLENRPQRTEKLAAMGVKIEHSEFTDEFGFRSYRAVYDGPAGQLFTVADSREEPHDAGRWAR